MWKCFCDRLACMQIYWLTIVYICMHTADWYFSPTTADADPWEPHCALLQSLLQDAEDPYRRPTGRLRRRGGPGWVGWCGCRGLGSHNIPLVVGAWSSNIPLVVGAWSSNIPLVVGAWSSNIPLAVGSWSSNIPLVVGAWSSNIPLVVGSWSSNIPLVVAWSSNIPLVVGAWSSNIPLVVGAWSPNIPLVVHSGLEFQHSLSCRVLEFQQSLLSLQPYS